MAGSLQPYDVAGVRDLTPAVRELLLAPRTERMDFAPGQWVSLHLPVGERQPLVRAYSLAEPQQASGHLVLALDRVPNGLGSSYLFSLRVGDTVELDGPYGNFVAPQPAPKELLFLARYTGIVPIRCIITHLRARHPRPNMTLIYNAAKQEDLIYYEEFERHALDREQFHYLPIIASDDDPMTALRPTLQTIASSLGQPPDFAPMICGVKVFVRPLRAWFQELGFERREVRRETFD